MNKPIIIVGDGGHASVLIETLITLNKKILGYTAPKERKELFHLVYLGTDDVIESYCPNEVELVIGLGTVGVSTFRKELFESYKKKGYTFTSVIHPSANLSPSVKLGEGVQIMAGVIMQTNVNVFDNVIINTGVIIDHDCKVKSHTHIAPGTTLSGSVTVGQGCHIGTGSAVIQGISIGDGTLIGAGSVVVTTIGSNKKAYGVPAKEV
ncbi:acetyltransferase [Sporosarcina sp. GW1-11]|uniref:acetyltransferase n=1 Tax=Sporosarcina sp. GW1-11 TaxID=2899126 RepID=UPI00294D0AB3|nr:acetyltransferase [Sporosarcina sp. GW1-11]MDV6376982.1 acetyltransferase [Sporosarcina sp. GW1-11]